MLFHLPLGGSLYSPKVFITLEPWMAIVYVNTSTIQFKGNWKHFNKTIEN